VCWLEATIVANIKSHFP